MQSARRKRGYVCGPDTVWQKEFEEMFPYEGDRGSAGSH